MFIAQLYILTEKSARRQIRQQKSLWLSVGFCLLARNDVNDCRIGSQGQLGLQGARVEQVC